MNTKQMIQHTKEEAWYIQPYFTLNEQDSDSRFYDDEAANRVTEMVDIEGGHHNWKKALIVSRTRLEFTDEHIVWADSEYMKSLGNEANIYSAFIKSQGVQNCL